MLIGLAILVPIWFAMFFMAVYWNPALRTWLPYVSYEPFFVSRQAAFYLWFPLSVYLGLAAGFLEEVLYRAFLIRSLERVGLKPWQAGCLSLAAFVLIHLSSGAHIMVLAFMTGGIFTVYYLRYRAILPLVVCHSAIDILWVSGYSGTWSATLFRALGLGGA